MPLPLNRNISGVEWKSCLYEKVVKVVAEMNKKDKEKMLELIKKKQGGGRSEKMETPKNDRTNMRKGPKIFNK